MYALTKQPQVEIFDLPIGCEAGRWVRAATVSRDGGFAGAMLDDEGTARVYHLNSHAKTPFENITLPVAGRVAGIAFRPESRELALAISDHHSLERFTLGLAQIKGLPMFHPQCISYSRDGALPQAAPALRPIQHLLGAISHAQ